MIRRQTRLRREYLFSKSVHGKQKMGVDRRQMTHRELAEGKKDELKFFKLGKPLRHITDDSEYANAGIRNPKIMITTAHEPSNTLRQFAKEMSKVIPNSYSFNRGRHPIKELIQACRENDVTDFIQLFETRGVPTSMFVSHMPLGPTAYFGLCNCVMRKEMENPPPISTQYPHLVFHNFTTPLGKRVTTILKSLFPVPKADSNRTISFINQNDYISFRHHLYKHDGPDIALTNVGPQFELRLFRITLGTIDDKTAQVEWVLHNFMNSTKSAVLL
ncbi:U3 small nucleolar ribonucleoprotein IMP4 [Pelomyxa schiedti]|nr:U3 small nucleolar ribonucleoprotein IMP4 [Pelomyxa schiedti]